MSRNESPITVWLRIVCSRWVDRCGLTGHKTRYALTHRTIARSSREMKEWVAILIVWQATPFDQPYELTGGNCALHRRPDNEV